MAQSAPTNQDKQAIWQAYYKRQPTRVPMRLSSNPRVFLLNPQFNTEGYTFEQAAVDPLIHIHVSLGWQHYLRTVLNHCTDSPTGPPEVWDVSLCGYNVYEAAFFGAAVQYPEGQVPVTEPIVDDANKRDILDFDVDHPLDNPFIQKRLAFWHEMRRICDGLTFEGRPVRLIRWLPVGTDGQVTVACNLRGGNFMLDLVEDPDYAAALMDLITRAAIRRREALWQYWGSDVGKSNGMADDSCEMLSARMYEKQVSPFHRAFYDAAPANLPRLMHLCGNATRHFPLMRQKLDIDSFDTGFPVDHGGLRRTLGPDVEISGGVEVVLLLNGSPNDVYERSRQILESGVKQGGRFIFQEANNLPPNVPLENLQAMYQACLDFGGY